MALKSINVSNTSIATARRENLVYVDKTMFIPQIESGAGSNAIVFLRPRRFGKTFLADTLDCYYDKSLSGKFDANFEGTWIHSHKTPKASSYCCLRFDFSPVLPDTSLVEESFARRIALGIMAFSRRYPSLSLSTDEIKSNLHLPPSELISLFLSTFALQAENGEKIYLIIDEYDHFANDILSNNAEAFVNITSTAQNHKGFIKSFYAALKQYFGQDDDSKPIAKFFITGVSAVSLDSLTSGFNIATNISDLPGFNSMVGFTHDELSKIVDEAVDFSVLKPLTKAELMDVMEKNFDGYVFSKYSRERIFNTTMCLSFLNRLILTRSVQDVYKNNNLNDDAGKIKGIMKLAPADVQQKITECVFKRESIPAEEPGTLNLNASREFSEYQVIWMLAYLGYLTIEPAGETPRSMLNYRCPNEAIYRTFVACISAPGDKEISGAPALGQSLQKGDIAELVTEVEKSVASLPSAAFSGFNERSLQLRFYYLIIQSPFTGSLEPILEADTGDHGRADLYVKNSSGGPDMLFEFKYLSKTKANDQAVASEKAVAKEQLSRYCNSPKFKGKKNLEAWAVVFAGPKAAAVERV